MDVNNLTKAKEPDLVHFTKALSITILFCVISCGQEPEEGEIVIRAGDIVVISDSSSTTEDTLSMSIDYVDTAAADTADTLTVSLDSVSVDSLPEIRPDTAECPWDRIAIEINGSIYASLQGRNDNPDILGAHIVRCMWWDTNPWRGMNAGDSLYVLIGETGRENQVEALSYVPREGTSNSPFAVYSFRMTGDNYPSHYYFDGTESMKLLNFMPVNTFEEMTGPYGEPRGNHSHSGVDYKAPAGTPIRTCRGGCVTRINWNHDYNGNCVEIGIGSGYSEIFLHLQSIADGIHEGVILEKGDVIGYVGNTGVTSTSAHVHYQINDENGNSIDPYLFYSSHRRSLPQEDMERFCAFRDSCDVWMRASAD